MYAFQIKSNQTIKCLSSFKYNKLYKLLHSRSESSFDWVLQSGLHDVTRSSLSCVSSTITRPSLLDGVSSTPSKTNGAAVECHRMVLVVEACSCWFLLVPAQIIRGILRDAATSMIVECSLSITRTNSGIRNEIKTAINFAPDAISLIHHPA